MATITFGTTAGNWNTAALWVGGAKPTAGDDAVLAATSGNCTIDAASVCRSLDASAYGAGKVLTHNAFTLTIGDGTAGAGNKALDFSGGFTYTLANATTSAISFVSTSTTVQAVNGGNKTFGNVTFNGANGTWQLTGVVNTGATATVTVTTGRLDWNNQNCSWGMYTMAGSATRRLTPGSTTSITLTGTSSACIFGSATGLTIDANTATITCTGALATNQSAFTSGATNFNGLSLVLSGGGAQAGIMANSTGTTLGNLTRTGTAVKTDSLRFAGSLTITGTFTCTGNSAINRVLVYSNTVGTPVTITAAAISVDNTDFQDITGAGAATWDMSALSVGNCGGNSMKALGDNAFPASATQTATGTSSFTWSTHGWTSRVPLPQDDVVINNAFSASQTITADMPRLGRSISFTGATGTPAWAWGSLVATFYGDLTLISGMTWTGTTSDVQIKGRTTVNITTAGISIPNSLNIGSPNGIYNLMDNFYAVGNCSINAGTFNTNDYSLNTNFFNANASLARTINFGASTVTSRGGRSTIWDFGGAGVLTFNAGTSTVIISDTSATQKLFIGNGKTFYNVTITGRNVLITGSNTFTGTLANNTGGLREGLYVTAGTTQTVNNYTVNGVAGKYGGIISLNGTSDAFSAVDHADFQPTGNFSVSAWIQMRTNSTWKSIFQSYSSNTNNAGWYFMITNQNKVFLVSGKNTGSVLHTDVESAVGTTDIVDGAWHHVVGTYDGARLRVYLDGNLDGTSAAWANAPVYAATNYVRVGCNNNSGTNINFFIGQLDEVTLYNGTALDATQVATLYATELNEDATLKALATVYYRFEAGAETVETIAGARTLSYIGTPSGMPNVVAKLRSSTSGLYGGGITLNGTNMAYSAVDHADFRPAGNFSVMCVFKTSRLATVETLFQSYTRNTNEAGIYMFIRTDNKIEVRSGKNTGTVSGTDYRAIISTAATYCDGALHKIIFTYDGAKIHLYIDGTEDTTGSTWTNAAAFAATNYVRVGCSNYTGTNLNWHSGLLDEVALWNGTALSAANVTTLQSSQLADSAALLASSTVYYKFDIGAETTDTDAGAHTLTAIGSPVGTTPGKLAKPTKHDTVDYMDVADTTFQGGTKWYASTHSVDGGGNTGIAFSAEVPDGKGFFRLVR